MKLFALLQLANISFPEINLVSPICIFHSVRKSFASVLQTNILSLISLISNQNLISYLIFFIVQIMAGQICLLN